MRIVCIDSKTDDGKWMKQWADLKGDRCTMEIHDRHYCATAQDNVILLHLKSMDYNALSAMENAQNWIRAQNNSNACLFLVVTGGEGIKNWTSDDGYIHVSKTKFDNSPAPLTHLKARFQRLLSTLAAAKTFEERKAAWEVFENHQMFLLPALSVLCQSYLAIWYVVNKCCAPSESELNTAMVSIGAHNLDKISETCKDQLATMRNMVEGEQYLKVIQDKDSLETLVIEIEGMDTVSKQSITDLLAVNGPLKFGNPEPVAKAYNAICSFLSEQS